MEGFWETVCDWAILLLKVLAILFIIDSGLYILGYKFTVPFVREAVVVFFHALGYSRPY